MDLNVLRERVNDIDDQMVDLFVERMQVAAEIANAKAEKNLPVLDLRREQAVLQKVMERAGEEFEIYVNKLYQTMFDVSKSYQSGILYKETELSREILKNIENPPQAFPRKAVVACQGVEGSYASRACDRLFGMPSKMYFIFQKDNNISCAKLLSASCFNFAINFNHSVIDNGFSFSA